MTSSLAWDSSSLDQELILCLGPVALHVRSGGGAFCVCRCESFRAGRQHFPRLVCPAAAKMVTHWTGEGPKTPCAWYQGCRQRNVLLSRVPAEAFLHTVVMSMWESLEHAVRSVNFDRGQERTGILH